MNTDPLIIAGKTYRSRLLTGTGKFKDLDETRRATEAAGAEIVPRGRFVVDEEGADHRGADARGGEKMRKTTVTHPFAWENSRRCVRG